MGVVVVKEGDPLVGAHQMMTMTTMRIRKVQKKVLTQPVLLVILVLNTNPTKREKEIEKRVQKESAKDVGASPIKRGAEAVQRDRRLAGSVYERHMTSNCVLSDRMHPTAQNVTKGYMKILRNAQ